MSFAPTAEQKVARARSAQQRWGLLPTDERVRVLRGLRHRLAGAMDGLVQVLAEEVGKPPMDAVAGDLMVTLEQLRWNEQHAAEALRSRRLAQPPFFYRGARFQEHHEPFGVVLVLAPWNYPVQLALVPAATALVAGNAVLLKCSEKTPRTAALLAELVAQSGLEGDLLQISCEQPEDARELVEARPDFIFFTGSTEGGRAVAQQAAALLIPTVMELGGKDAALVFATANLPRAARGLTYGAFSNSGQVCVSTRRIYVEQKVSEQFRELLVSEVSKLRQGASAESDIGPVRIAGVEARLRAQIEDAIARGATALAGWPAAAGALGPVVLADVPGDSDLATQEAFGPVVWLATFESEQEAVALANSSPWALSSSVWTGDSSQAKRVSRALKSGSCAVNDAIRNIGNPYAPFGGNGASGWGRYHGREGLHTFARSKTVMKTGQTRAREIHWFPFSARLLGMMQALMRLRHGAGSTGKRLANLMRSVSAVLLICAAGAAAAQAPSGDLSIRVKLTPGAHGKLGYLVFSSPAGFPDVRDKALRHAFVPVTVANGEQTIDIGSLPAGQYAITVYLDANGNGKLDKGFLGIPKEPVGGSNNPKSRMGPPSFRDCAFQHGSGAQTVDITLVH